MPLINVHMARGRTAQQKTAFMAAVTEAAIETLGSPRDSIRVWITEVDSTDFMTAGELLSDKQARQRAIHEEAS